MITATDLEVRAGARILLSAAGSALRVQPGDRIGLVGRNGAGKTTTMRILAGDAEPYAGTIHRKGEIGYLPQDPKEGNLEVIARDRVLSARGLDTLMAELEKQQAVMAEVVDDAERDKAVRRYGQLEERFAALGGYVAESEAARICSSLGLPDRVLTQPLRTLSGGQRRRVELARILFAAGEGGGNGSDSSVTLLLDEPTNHLDADSLGWLRDFLQNHSRRSRRHQPQRRPARRRRQQGLVPRRGARRDRRLQHGLAQVPRRARHRRTTPPPRTRQRRTQSGGTAGPRRPSSAPRPPKPLPRRTCCRRADRMMAALDDERVADKVARIKFPTPAPCGRTPLTAKGLTQELRLAGSVQRRRSRDRPRVQGGGARPQRRRQDHAAEAPGRGRRPPTPACSSPDMVAGSAISRRSTTLWTTSATVWENIRHAAPDSGEQDLRGLLGAFMFSGPQLDQLRRHAVRRREDPPRARRSRGVDRERAVARRAHQQPRPRVARAGARRAAQLRRRGRAGDPRPRRRRGARPATRGAAARRHRRLLVRGLLAT